MKSLLSLLALLMLISSCATRPSKGLRYEKDQIPDPQDVGLSLYEQTHEMIETNPELDEKQRVQFLDLHAQTHQKVMAINEEIRKYKVLLFQEFMNSKYNQAKVDQITGVIKTLNNDQLKTMMNSMRQARKILGVKAPKILDEKRFIRSEI